MSRPQRAAAGPDDDELFEFSGTITDYWSYTQVRDYVMLMPGMTHTAYRHYSLLRSMIKEANRRPPSGMRRMSLDQMCWLLPGPNDKPLSINAMREVMKTLEVLKLVVPKDSVELAGITGLKGAARSAKGIARGYTVNDLPPEAVHFGWRNAWDKLDAYTPDWRENPPQPPTHLTEVETSANGQSVARVRLVNAKGRPFQKSGTPQAGGGSGSPFQKTGTPDQKTGTADQKTGTPDQISETDLALTCENDHPLRSSLQEAPLSPDTGAPSVPADSAEKGSEERENPAPPTTKSPQPKTAVDPTAALSAAVAEQFAELFRNDWGTRPSRRQLDAIAVDSVEALADGDAVEWLTEMVVPFMVKRRYFDLGRAKTHPQCPPPATRLPGQRADSVAGQPAVDCKDCYGSGWTDDLSARCPCTAVQPAAVN